VTGKRLILTGICSLFFLFSCSQRREKRVTFAVGGTPSELEFWEILVQEFHKKTGIEVILDRQPTDTDLRRQALLVSLQSRQNDPDIFLMDIAWLAQFAASSWLFPLDDFMLRDNMIHDIFFQKVLNLADRFRGNLVALPVYVDGGLLYYRKDLLQKYGFKSPPETWKELVEYALEIQRKEREQNPDFYGFLWQGAQYEGLICNFIEFAGSNRGGLLLEGGVVRLNSEENRAALQFMYDLIHEYRISPPSTFTEMKEEEVRRAFEQGNALFERNWPYAWALHQAEDSPVKGNVGILPLPSFPGGESVSALGGWHIGISKYSDAQQESFEFLKFIASFEIQKRLALQLGWNPGRKDVYYDEEVLSRLPHFSALKEVFEKAQPRPVTPVYTQISEILQRYINAVLSGKLRPEEALGRSEEEIEKLTGRYYQ